MIQPLAPLLRSSSRRCGTACGILLAEGTPINLVDRMCTFDELKGLSNLDQIVVVGRALHAFGVVAGRRTIANGPQRCGSRPGQGRRTHGEHPSVMAVLRRRSHCCCLRSGSLPCLGHAQGFYPDGESSRLRRRAIHPPVPVSGSGRSGFVVLPRASRNSRRADRRRGTRRASRDRRHRLRWRRPHGRRVYAGRGGRRSVGDQSGGVYAAPVRSGEGSRPGRDDRDAALDSAGGNPDLKVCEPGRVDCAGETDAGKDQLRQWRRRVVVAPRDGDAEGRGRDRPPARSLQGNRAGGRRQCSRANRTSLFGNLLTSRGAVQSGRLRAIAIASANRSPASPDLPTIAEAGVPGYAFESWFGIVAPAGTSADNHRATQPGLSASAWRTRSCKVEDGQRRRHGACRGDARSILGRGEAGHCDLRKARQAKRDPTGVAFASVGYPAAFATGPMIGDRNQDSPATTPTSAASAWPIPARTRRTSPCPSASRGERRVPAARLLDQQQAARPRPTATAAARRSRRAGRSRRARAAAPPSRSCASRSALPSSGGGSRSSAARTSGRGGRARCSCPAARGRAPRAIRSSPSSVWHHAPPPRCA